MKNKILLDALSGIDEKYINEGTPGGRKRNGGTLAKLAVVAACLCIVVGVSLYIPYSTKKPPDNIPSAGEISDDRGNMTVDTSTEVTTNNPVDTEVHSENPAGTENQDVTTAGTTFNQDDPAIGGADYCKVHSYSYHSVPGELMEYISTKNGIELKDIENWISSFEIDKSKLDSETECSCEFNIKVFIDKYGITKDEFYDNCAFNSTALMDVDLLYSGNDSEIDEFFRDKDEYNVRWWKNMSYLKLGRIIRERYPDKISELNPKITIPEMIMSLSIERSDIEKYIAEAAKFYEDQNGVCYTFDYNLDMIYGTGEVQAGEVSFEPLADILSVNEDDDPTNDISSGELDEMFCRVGRYAE